VDHHGYAIYMTVCELGAYGVDGIVDPGAHPWMAVLVHWEVVGSGRQEGSLRVNTTVVQDVVDGNGEERVERRQQGEAFVLVSHRRSMLVGRHRASRFSGLALSFEFYGDASKAGKHPLTFIPTLCKF